MSSVDKLNIDETENQDDHSNIIYITIAIIISLTLLWSLIVFITGEDPIKILNEMTNLASQTLPVNDNT